MSGRAAALLLAAALLGCAGCAGGPRPNIVLVSIDSLRADHLGCYGYPKPTSPHIDRLAAEGVRFANAVSTTSWTLPAHAALFTGLYDSAHGLVDNGLRLGETHVTLAEVLRDAGYRTAGFYGGPYLHPTFGLAQGFDHYASCAGGGDASEDQVRMEALLKIQPSHADVTGPRLLERVTQWLSTLDGGPVFVFLHLWDVHYDYIPPPGYAEIFDPDYRGSLDARRYFENPAIHEGMSARDREHLLALYDGEIRFTDDILRQVLERIDAHGGLDDALLVITADHGDEFFEHGGKGHKRTLFDEVVRVPLIVRWPGHLEAGRVVEDQVRLIDVMPTICALAGLPVPAQLQGRDLSPLLRGEALEPREALTELQLGPVRFRALRTNRSKIIAYDAERYAFYDLQRDPGETLPLHGSTPGAAEAVRSLRAAVALSEALHRRLGEGAIEAHVLDRQVAERLRELGYLSSPR